jgi:hypothetical protein
MGFRRSGDSIPATDHRRRAAIAAEQLAVLASFTREQTEQSPIEEFVGTAIRESTAILLDKEMFSTNAPTAASPGGILAGATTVTPTTDTGLPGISKDVGALVQALAQHGAGLEPVLVAAPAQATALRMWGQTDNFDVCASLALAAGTVVAVERSSFVSGLNSVPVFSVSLGAALHFESATPTDITGGSPSPAVPVRSMFQDDLIGLRMILQASWGMRNPAHVAIVSGVSW